MPGRRRDQRFTLSVPWEGALCVPADVVIEEYGDKEVSVVSNAPAHRDELLTLDAAGTRPGTGDALERPGEGAACRCSWMASCVIDCA